MVSSQHHVVGAALASLARLDAFLPVFGAAAGTAVATTARATLGNILAVVAAAVLDQVVHATEAIIALARAVVARAAEAGRVGFVGGVVVALEVGAAGEGARPFRAGRVGRRGSAVRVGAVEAGGGGGGCADVVEGEGLRVGLGVGGGSADWVGVVVEHGRWLGVEVARRGRERWCQWTGGEGRHGWRWSGSGGVKVSLRSKNWWLKEEETNGRERVRLTIVGSRISMGLPGGAKHSGLVKGSYSLGQCVYVERWCTFRETRSPFGLGRACYVERQRGMLTSGSHTIPRAVMTFVWFRTSLVD